ncbi:MAG: class I SAM-dependent methyltransferase [Planctomycetaceae bacterium]|jgi:ubiquinone/menaquinone biosynthesis C-methylase UbiE|nr:class I SAM-dependent methyltransferase [Planctomycetaceae bacterium]MBT4012947.1 class I SAM-dependent methyltransferase [Planctomycetaceae bacterium]MBT4723466.1 class I SAM-dependent methyltransferase [Planctomycetaceae bacterium]MBT4846164.1 class I SAM-dependent methyltransferase [Planctomycetaceae bacterium]MBT5125894.1 class I SAM-dependent methyltransferase [Planctomycetaceae bacterium]
MVVGKRCFTKPAKDEDLHNPLGVIDAQGWLGGDIANQQVLCLAAGGGRQSAIYAAAGANVTVVDISPAMLELDRQVAQQRGFELRIVEASMDDLSVFSNAEFDIVIQPVSTCYLPNIAPIFMEVARVLRSGGIYISQHKQPTSLQTSLQRSENGWTLDQPYYRTGPLPMLPLNQGQGSRLREEGTHEYLHRWEDILGGMCRTGFVIEDFIEPFHADPDADRSSFGDRCHFTAPYMRIKARRSSQVTRSNNKPQLVIPD